MTEQGLISIVIPTYQHGATISACLASVFNQTYKNIEVIVVNDGSTDNTLDALEPFSDQIELINQTNQGANPARNSGFRVARGEFIIFCDADVRMRPEMLEKMKRALDAYSNKSYAYSAHRFGWKLFKGVPFDDAELMRQNFIHTTSLVRAEDFPGFDDDIKRLQDWDVWLTMLAEGKRGILVSEVLYDVEISGESRIGSSWIPSFMYRIPWRLIGWRPKQIKKYEDARGIIRKKHNL